MTTARKAPQLLLGTFLLVACADAAGETLEASGNLGKKAGTALQDAGAWLAHMGDNVSDAGQALGSDAAAQDATDAAVAPAPTAPAREVVELACSRTYDWTTRIQGTTETYQRIVRTYAELDIADAALIKSMHATRCGREAPPACPTGFVCAGAVDPVASFDCEAGAPIQVSLTRLRVLCGEARASGDTRALEWSSKFKTVKLTIER